MKRWGLFFMTLVLLFCFGACGQAPASPPEQQPTAAVEVERMETSSAATALPAEVQFTREYFEGRKAIVFGDSISARAYLESNEKDYVDCLAESLGFTYTRRAVRGSRLTALLDNPVTIRSGLDLIQSDRDAVADADVAFVAYGTNDFPSNVPIGLSDDRYARWQDVGTFKGAINFAVKTLKDYNPDIRIVFFTPIYRSDRFTNGKNGRLTDYVQAIIDMAAVHAYRAVDMYTGVGFNGDNFLAGGAYTHDGLHPNAAGHKMMADFVVSPENRDPATVAPPPTEQPTYAPCDVRFTQKYFAGKTVVSYGDSISAHATLAENEKDYVDLLSEVLGFTATHLARSGSRLTGKLPVAHTTRTGVDLISSNRAHNEAADVALIAYGTNDFASDVPIGEEDDAFEKWQDVDTFKGAINFAVKTLRAHNPEIRIVFLTPIYRDNQFVNKIGKTLPDYCNAVAELGERYDCLVLDMYNGVGFDRENFGQRSKYTIDALHPNALGHAKMAQYILQSERPQTQAVATARKAIAVVTDTEDMTVQADTESQVQFTRKYFRDKTVVSYGDSISARSRLGAGEKDYIALLSETLGFEAVRFGLSASCLTDKLPAPIDVRSGADLIASNRASNAAADVAFIAYGINDFVSDVPIGSNDDAFESWQDVDTFKGAINFAVDTLRAHNPDIEIVFLAPIYHKRAQEVNKAGEQLIDYCDAVLTLGALRGCLVLDMYHNVGFDSTNFYAGAKYTTDGAHPSAVGHAKMAQYILHSQEEETQL